MKAIVKKERKPGLALDEVPKPKIGDDDILIKVRKSSICGTDIHIMKWDNWAQKTISPPLVIGHEFMGEIAELGKNVTGFQVGERVSAEGHITCGICPNCQKGLKHLCVNTLGLGVQRPGAFAEYVSMPAENVFALPNTISDNLAAIFDPFGNATHTALSFPLTGEDVRITGAGPIGMMVAAIAKHAGARHVVTTDINDYRLQLAQQLGATTTINVSRESLAAKTRALGIDWGYTVGFEMSGNPQALNSMLQLMLNGGKIALLGILPSPTAIDWDLVIFKMLQIQGIYGRQIFGTWQQMTHMLESGLNLDPIITHHFSVEEFQKGFDLVSSGKSGKVILDWEK